MTVPPLVFLGKVLPGVNPRGHWAKDSWPREFRDYFRIWGQGLSFSQSQGLTPFLRPFNSGRDWPPWGSGALSNLFGGPIFGPPGEQGFPKGPLAPYFPLPFRFSPRFWVSSRIPGGRPHQGGGPRLDLRLWNFLIRGKAGLSPKISHFFGPGAFREGKGAN